MSEPLLLDIVTYLTSAGVVQGDGIDTFRDFSPEMPDNLVVISEYTGSPVVPYEPTVHRSVQVSARDKSADDARRKALEIFKQFQQDIGEDGRLDFTPSRWGQVSLRQPPSRVSTDKSDRVSYAFNIGITTTID